MRIPFFKYQGTGNDFIIIDDRNNQFLANIDNIIRICDRKFGIGSDGLILIQNSSEADFHMEFFNPDASQSFCGNGSRCAVAFAYRIGIIEKETKFTAIDGLHSAYVESPSMIKVSIKNVEELRKDKEDLILNTGSPHLVRFSEDLDKEDIISIGRKIRFSEKFKQDGINVNLVEVLSDNKVRCATYERGVENETLSCGTGVTAVALAANKLKNLASPLSISTKGGNLEVEFEYTNDRYENISLKGPATFVYKGDIEI